MDKNCGIYKVTSPSGRVYIGQAVNIKRRFRQYENLTNCERQTKLYRSFKKHGAENHQFDIIEYCSKEELNCSERFWQDEFDVLNGGLNCVLQECGEQRRVFSENTIELFSERKKGEKNPMYGKNSFNKNSYKRHKDNPKSSRGNFTTRGDRPEAKKVIDILTGEIWNSMMDAAEANNISYRSIGRYLNNPEKNTTNLRFL